MMQTDRNERHGNKPAPPDRRPYRKMHEPGLNVDVYTPDGPHTTYRQTFRQVGWLGQSGAFYALDEDPMGHEPGGWAPLYFVAHSDTVEIPDPEEAAGETR